MSPAIVIKTRVSFSQYARLLFTLTYRKPMMWLILVIGAAMWAWIFGYYCGLLPVPEPLIYQYITAVLITFVQPSVIFLMIWKNYHSSAHLQEALEMRFDSELIQMKGKSFFTELTWKNIHRIQELKNWYLIYQNSLSAIIIPKKSFGSMKNDAFKSLLSEVPGLGKRLNLLKSG